MIFTIAFENNDGKVETVEVEALREEGALMLFGYRHLYRRILTIREKIMEVFQ